MSKKQKIESLSPKELEIEQIVKEQTADKDLVKNKNKIKGYKGLKKLMPYYSKHKKHFVWFMAVLIITNILGFVMPVYDAKTLSAITSADFDNAIIYAFISFAVFMVYNVGNWGSNRIWISMDNKVLYDMRQDIMKSVCNVKMSKVDKTSSGVFIDRIISDSGKCSDILLEIVLAITNLVANFCFLVYIAFLNFWLFLIMVVYVVVSYVLDEYRFRRWYINNKGLRARREIVVGAYTEQVKGVKDIKSLNLKNEMLKDSGEKFSYVLKKNMRERAEYYRDTFLFKKPVIAILEFAILIVGILFIKGNIVSLTTFIIVYMYRGKVNNLAQQISQIKQNAVDGELCAQRVFEVIDDFPKEQFGDKILPEPVKGTVSFKNVSFSYDSEKQVLKNISFDIEQNKTTAIVGKSGCGKSTILSLVNKLYDKDSGEITIDGVEISQLTEQSLRNSVGVVTQAPYIFNATIKNNLLYAKPDATDDELWDALKKAQIDEFVKEQKYGIESRVGENGVMLSGGQRQRLAIARVLLKGSKIIAFDEATSALDNKSQGALVEEVDKLKDEHTIIIVAHRLSTIVNADKIIVIDDGSVVAEGTHKQLMKSCKTYKELYESEEKASELENDI